MEFKALMNCLKGSLLNPPPLPDSKTGKSGGLAHLPNPISGSKRGGYARPVTAIPPRGPVNPYMLQGAKVPSRRSGSRQQRPGNDSSSQSVYYQHSSNVEDADLLEKVRIAEPGLGIRFVSLHSCGAVQRLLSRY